MEKQKQMLKNLSNRPKATDLSEHEPKIQEKSKVL
jgi:hypothetical protein